TKYLVEWSASPDFAECRASNSISYAVASVHSQVVDATLATADGRAAYTIDGLPTGTKQFVRVSAFNGNYGSPVLAQIVTVSSPTTSEELAIVTIWPDVESLAPQAQLPYRPTTVTMQVSSMDQPTQLEVRFTDPTANALGFQAGDGGTDISYYRISWWDPSEASTASAAQRYDTRMVTELGDPLVCSPSACMFPLGAEVQTLALAPDVAAGGSFRLVLATASYPRELCSNCVVGVSAPSDGIGSVDYASLALDLQLELGTNARFVVDADGAACVFQVAAVASLLPDKLPVRFVGAANGATTCSLSSGTFSVHTQPTTAVCVPVSSSADDLSAAVSTLLDGDEVVASVETEIGGLRRFRVTFTGSSDSGASGDATKPHVADVAQLEVVALDGTAGCTDVAGNVWTSTELNGGVLTPGVAYAVQVAAINSVGLGAPLRASALCHDMPCASGSTMLAPAAPPLAPLDVTVASNRADRTALDVVWTAPAKTNGMAVARYLVEFSTVAFMTQPSICSGCIVALTAGTAALPPTLTLNHNINLAPGQLVVLSSITPSCLLAVSEDPTTYKTTAWTGTEVVYNMQPQNGCDPFDSATSNLDSLLDLSTEGYIAVIPSATGTQQMATTLNGLTANTEYTVRVRAQNAEGFGAAQIATPVCESGLEACDTLSTAVTRQLPAAPVLTVPTQLLGAGVSGATANALGFTKDTLTVAFSDPNSWSGLERVDWFRVEWDETADFSSPNKQTVSLVTPSASTLPSLWLTRQLCASCVTTLGNNVLTVDGSLSLAIDDWITVDAGSLSCQLQVANPALSAATVGVVAGHGCSDFLSKTLALDLRETYEYHLTTGLTMGATTHVRVTAHNSLGYGVPSDSLAVAPIVSSDPPPSPYVALTALTPEDEEDPETRVTSLRVLFLPPIVALPTDENGDGGSPVTKYLVEWIDTSEFSDLTPQIQTISTASTSTGVISGSFRLTLDTSGCGFCQIQGIYGTSALSASASAEDMARELRNLPNVGDVAVTRGVGDVAVTGDVCDLKNQCVWTVTFLSELGVVPAFTYSSRLSAVGGTTSITVASSQAGSLGSATYCPSTTNGVATSGPTACGVVVVNPETTPVPYEYTIRGLTPGTTYYARVAAFNALGFGPRRVTAPTSLSVPFEAPSQPTSPFNVEAPPVLTLAGPTALLVSFAPPEFDGGTPVTNYVIEWDPSLSFDSGANGDALAQVTLAVSSLVAATDGAYRYRIDGLVTRQWVYVRVYAENGQVGTGLPVLTEPAREMPRGKPAAPTFVTATNDAAAQPPGSALLVSWRAPKDAIDVLRYDVEWYRQADTMPLFGLPVVQVVQTTGNLTGGSFSLAFGDGSERYPWQLLPGAVSVETGDTFLQTTVDLTGFLSRGDVVYLSGEAYLVAASGEFSASRLPLASANDFQDSGMLANALGATPLPYPGDTQFGVQLFTPWRTVPLALDATPTRVQEALELLPSVGLVRVERFQVDPAANSNFNWFVTFVSQVPRPGVDFPLLVVNDHLLEGSTNTNAAASTQMGGQTPEGFGSASVSISAGPGNDGVMTYSIPRLDTGAAYFVRVAAANERGVGAFASAGDDVYTLIGAAPTRPPLALSNVAARVLSPQVLELSFDEMATSGGLEVDGYRVEAALSAAFPANSIAHNLPSTTKYARVTTAAHTGPFTADSTFSLAAVDSHSFHGKLVVQVNALASGSALDSGAAFLLRLAPDASQGYGDAELHATFSRGERLRIRNEVASVCLDGSVAWPLRIGVTSVTSVAYDAGSNTVTLSAALVGQLGDVVVPGTRISIGAVPNSAAACRARVTTVVDSSHLKLYHTCVEPDAKLNSNLPIFVHRGPAVLPLCESEDPWTPLNASAISALVTRLDVSGGLESLPLFRSDTAAGVATELGRIGTSDFVTLVQPLAIDCGDYIRLGRAAGDGSIDNALEAAATFRVQGKCDGSACDCSRSEANLQLQLGSLDDPTQAVSLSPRLALAHDDATREVQRLVITLTGSAIQHNEGGFRVQFGDEVSSLTLGTGGDGGDSLNDDVGCLVWSSGPLSSDEARDMLTLERELEGFDAIDDVRVMRSLTETRGVSATVEYTVEFLGAQGRGKQPTLQILDLGTHGCSAFSGGTTSASSVVRDQNSFVTIYKAPTTPHIPFDASDEDVKAALETLSVVSNADVTRQVNKHGFDWRVTFVTFPAPPRELETSVFPALATNGYALSAVQAPSVLVTRFQRIELNTASLSGAGGGVSVYLRARAHNADGWGVAAVPTPASLQLAPQLPDPVRFARATPLSSSKVLVQWDEPQHDGGEPVTEFRVEWWAVGSSASAARPFAEVHVLDAAALGVGDDVATLTVSAPTLGTNTFLSGTFRVGFDGQWSSELPFDVSATEMQAALVALSTIEDVQVARELTASDGFTWLVTFLQRTYSGDQQKRWRSALATQPPFGYKLEVSGVNLLACTTADRSSCVPHLATGVAARAAVDATPELQTLVCVTNGNVLPTATMGFKLQLLGAETPVLAADADADTLSQALTDLGVCGLIRVRFRDPAAQSTLCSSSSALGVTLEFASASGDVPLVVVSSQTDVTVTIRELRKGRAQLHVGRMPFAYVIDGLSGAYNVRVAAYNSVGFGSFRDATDPGGLLLTARPPSAPRSIHVQAHTVEHSHGMLVVWTAPRSEESAVDWFRVEWDFSAGFTSQCGEHTETQTLLVTNVAPVTGKGFALLVSDGGALVDCVAVDYPTPAVTLQGKLQSLGGVYSDAEVTVQGDDSAIYDFGRSYTVRFEQTVVAPSAGTTAEEIEAAVTSPVDLPLLDWDSGNHGCELVAPGSVLVERSTYGPGLDEQRGQGRIDAVTNECSAVLAAPLARQTVDAIVATSNALQPAVLQLASTRGLFEGADLATPALCELCAQKLTSNGKLTVTASLVGILLSGQYFVVADGSASTTTRRCVMKAVSVGASLVMVDQADPGPAACELPATFEAKAWRISRFELRAHTIEDLVPGREYAVRVIAGSDAQGESAALATATTIAVTQW
ncbi:hypothetical protein BBJ28_00015958, partial [Nothophytophthora sp. Chile5]